MPFSPFWVRVPFSQFTFPLLFTSRVSKKFQNNFAVKKRCVCVVGGGGGGREEDVKLPPRDSI